MAVPVRRIQLSNGEHLDVHDTSGPYTDPSAEIDVEAGLPPTRDSWSRPDPIEGATTQFGVGRGQGHHPRRWRSARPGRGTTGTRKANR